jgi:hypothetical protein
VFAEAVTNHLFTQRVLSSIGFRDSGLTLGSAPVSQHFRGIEASPVAQRGSWTLTFKHLTPPPATPLYAPEHHRPMLERIYEHLSTPVAWDAPAAGPSDTPGGPGEVAVSFYPSWGFGEIIVERPGSESAAEIRQAQRDLRDLAGAEAIYLELPLARPETPALCRVAEGAGFFFAGLGPQFAADGDVLRLQFVKSALDTRQLQLLDPFTQEMLAYVYNERGRVG